MKTISRCLFTALSSLSCALLLATPALAQERDEYGEIRQTVARISYVSGEVSFARGDDPDNWQLADRNVPMTLGDRIYTGGQSRIELQVHGGGIVRLGARTDFAALNLTDDTKQFSMRAGIASFRIRRLSDYENFEVDTPNAAVTFERAGDYRVDVNENGDTRVMVRRGSATVAAAGGQLPVEQGEGIEIYGLDRPQYDYLGLARADGWDRWVDEREYRYERARSLRYISPDIVGVDDLDDYGVWAQVPQYGWCWSPRSVAVDWAPYRAGHWMWQDPWGWSWVSAEPWGWAPYHYGRWVVVSSRWYWVPVAPSVRYVSYSPALVAFVGGGPGWSLSVSAGGGGFIGWFPLGPRDPLQPWWGAHAYVRPTTVTNVTYVNRTYITVVNHNTFVSGGIVSGAVVRDRAVVTQVSSAPVLRGPIPAVPTAGALRVAPTREAVASPRPPAAIVSRSVVVRAAPPPAPPAFQAKLGVIRENSGAPVTPETAARISVESRGRARTVTDVRPAVQEPARGVTLAPRSGEAAGQGKRPEPVTASRGRPIATAEQPVASSPVTGPTSRGVAPRQSLPPAESGAQPGPEKGRERAPVAAPPSEAQPAPERGRERAPAPQSIPAQPPSGERGRPQTQGGRQIVAPTQPPPPAEQRRIEPAPGPPQAAPREPAPGAQRGRERPTPPPEASREAAPQGRRIGAPPAQQPPPGQPGVERGRERPTPVPEAPRQGNANPERGRERGQPGQPPAQPQGQPQPQGERPQVERGRPAPQKPEEQKKGKSQEKKGEENKDERGRKPTPTS